MWMDIAVAGGLIVSDAKAPSSWKQRARLSWCAWRFVGHSVLSILPTQDATRVEDDTCDIRANM
jgi:hypothetical protein